MDPILITEEPMLTVDEPRYHITFAIGFCGVLLDPRLVAGIFVNLLHRQARILGRGLFVHEFPQKILLFVFQEIADIQITCCGLYSTTFPLYKDHTLNIHDFFSVAHIVFLLVLPRLFSRSIAFYVPFFFGFLTFFCRVGRVGRMCSFLPRFSHIGLAFLAFRSLVHRLSRCVLRDARE